MHPHLSIVTLGVADLAASRRFYEGLGWPASPVGNDRIVFFQLGGMALALHPREMLAADAGVPPGRGGGFCGITLAHNLPDRASVDAAMAEAEAAGGRVVKPAQPTDWGGYSGYVADPDGYLWELAHNPFAVLTDDGRFLLEP